MFDIRTVIVLTVAYNILLGASILIYTHYRKGKKGIQYIGYGLLSIGLGFFLLSLRDYLDQWLTVILSNTLIVFGDLLILKGVKLFTNQYKKRRLLNGFIMASFVGLFLYFTYGVPSINTRVLIISLTQIYYFTLISKTMIINPFELLKYEGLIVSLIFILFVFINIIRIVFTLYEAPMNSFMTAGTIHSISIIFYQMLPFNLVMGIFFMDNTLIEHDLKTQAMTDGLTGLYNRAAFIKIVESECKRAERYMGSIGLVMCDIDYFKEINDKYGHQAGDLVLTKMSHILNHETRGSDVIARYGGEEFVMAFIDINMENLLKAMEKLRQQIERTEFVYNSNTIRLTMSFGVTIIEKKINLKQAIYNADMALYEAKESGRNCIRHKMS